MPAKITTAAKSTAKAEAAKGGDWDVLTICKAGNGFIVRKGFNYDPSKKPKADPPPYLATEPGDALSYLEHCLGGKEHVAHEKAEAKSGEKY